MYRTPYQHPAWKKVRLAVLERDQFCQLHGYRCKDFTRDPQVDHIVSWRSGGSWFDPTNLRAVCGKGNRDRVDHRNDARWLTAKTKIILIIGPPVPNLLYDYVQTHKRRDDYIVDYQSIVNQLGLTNQLDQVDLEEVTEIRNGRLADLRRGKIKAPRSLVTSSNPDAMTKFPYHDLITVDPGETKAIEMMVRGHVTPREIERVHEWYATRQGKTRATAAVSALAW